jgi:hypothetical protein
MVSLMAAGAAFNLPNKDNLTKQEEWFLVVYFVPIILAAVLFEITLTRRGHKLWEKRTIKSPNNLPNKDKNYHHVGLRDFASQKCYTVHGGVES